MSLQLNRQPVVWAIGRKGYIYQNPLLFALSEQAPVWAVTTQTNEELDKIHKKKWLLAALDVPTGIGSALKFIFTYPFNYLKIFSLIKNNASLVHITMSSPWDVFFINAIKKAKVPIVLTIHDATQHPGEESWLMDKIRQYLMRKADHIVVLTEHVKNELPSLQSQGVYAKNEIYIVKGHITRTEKCLTARSFPVGKTIKILFHGRIHAYKGLDILLDAAKIMQDRGVDFSLTIAGSGDLKPYLEKIKALLNTHITNEFLSNETVDNLLATHHIAALPYIEASQSGVAVDVMWAALPAVATPVGALPKQFTHDVNALIVDAITPDAIANALAKLCTDKSLYERLSHGAFDSYQKHSPEQVAKKWLQFYEKIQAIKFT